MFTRYRFWLKTQQNSKCVAKDRLQQVLLQDRTQVTPHFMEMLKADLTKVLEDYLELEGQSVELFISRIPQQDQKVQSQLVMQAQFNGVKKIGQSDQ